MALDLGLVTFLGGTLLMAAIFAIVLIGNSSIRKAMKREEGMFAAAIVITAVLLIFGILLILIGFGVVPIPESGL